MVKLQQPASGAPNELQRTFGDGLGDRPWKNAGQVLIAEREHRGQVRPRADATGRDFRIHDQGRRSVKLKECPRAVKRLAPPTSEADGSSQPRLELWNRPPARVS